MLEPNEWNGAARTSSVYRVLSHANFLSPFDAELKHYPFVARNVLGTTLRVGWTVDVLQMHPSESLIPSGSAMDGACVRDVERLKEIADRYPAAMGFERDFTLLQGGGSNWSDMTYPNPAHPKLNFTLNGKPLEKLPDDHFSSNAYTDFIIKCNEEHRADGKPFFAYLSFQAVHSPLAAPDDWLDKYKGVYDKGYDAIRIERLDRMKELGIVGKEAALWPRVPSVPAWDTLTAGPKKLSARRMEVYAAMLANMDFNIGRLVERLKQTGQYENTIVVFLSDNGAEPVELAELVETVYSENAKKWFFENFDTRPENWGRKGSATDYGIAWAQVGSTPFRFYKAWTAEGGIRAPLIISGAGVKNAGAIKPAIMHVTDLVPTFLELAGVEHPSETDPKLAPLRGKSLTSLLTGKTESVRTSEHWIGEELFGNRMVRQGEWKLCYIQMTAGGRGQGELFNLESDTAETIDLAKQYHEKVNAMLLLWDQYVKENGVILTDDGPFKSVKLEPKSRLHHR